MKWLEGYGDHSPTGMPWYTSKRSVDDPYGVKGPSEPGYIGPTSQPVPPDGEPHSRSGLRNEPSQTDKDRFQDIEGRPPQHGGEEFIYALGRDAIEMYVNTSDDLIASGRWTKETKEDLLKQIKKEFSL